MAASDSFYPALVSNTCCSNAIVAIVNEDVPVAVLLIAIVVAIETVVVAAVVVLVICATTFVSAIVFEVTKLFVQLL